MLKNALFYLAIFFVSCNNSTESTTVTKTETAPEPQTFPVKELIIDNGEEEGWGADIRLSVVSSTQTDSSNEYTALSTYQGKKIGLQISIKNLKEGANGSANGFTLKRTGEESDLLLQTLSKLYKQKPDTSLKFINTLSTTYVNLHEFAKTLGAKDGGGYMAPAEYKLFFEGEGDDDYAELYINVNPDEHWLEIREKDEEYRPAVIKFLKMKE